MEKKSLNANSKDNELLKYEVGQEIGICIRSKKQEIKKDIKK